MQCIFAETYRDSNVEEEWACLPAEKRIRYIKRNGWFDIDCEQITNEKNKSIKL